MSRSIEEITNTKGECSFCGSVVDTLATIHRDPYPKWCEVCRAALPVNSILDLRAPITNRDVLQAICAAANVVLARIAEAGGTLSQ